MNGHKLEPFWKLRMFEFIGIKQVFSFTFLKLLINSSAAY